MCTCSNNSAPVAEALVAGTVFQIEDMTCTHCAGTIRNALKEAMPGAKVSIDMDQQLVTVDGDPLLAASVIRDAGYEPVLR